MLFSCIAACILLHRMQGKHQDNNSDREYYFTAIAVARPPVLLLASCFIVCRANMRIMMVTGDYHHTAIAVGRLVGMIPGGSPIVILQAKSELGRQSPQSSSTAQTAILNSKLPRPGIQKITDGHDS